MLAPLRCHTSIRVKRIKPIVAHTAAHGMRFVLTSGISLVDVNTLVLACETTANKVGAAAGEL